MVVRCRPLNKDELAKKCSSAVHVDESRGTLEVKGSSASKHGDRQQRMFTFDTVFGPESKQVDVYNLTARQIVDSVLEGYNGKLLSVPHSECFMAGTGITITLSTKLLLQMTWSSVILVMYLEVGMMR